MKGVLNTRPRDQAAELSGLLRAAGYEPFEVPLVELVLLPEGVETLLSRTAENWDGFLLSSPNLLPMLHRHHRALTALRTVPWYLISARAKPQAEALGARVAFVPKQASLAGFLTELPRQERMRLLHPCSSATRLDPKAFAAKGVKVENLVVYAPQCPAGAAVALEAVWPKIQAAIFASGSAAVNLFQAAPQLGKTLGEAKGPLAVSIGPSATDALRAQGAHNPRVAPTADNAGLIAALNAAFSSSSEART